MEKNYKCPLDLNAKSLTARGHINASGNRVSKILISKNSEARIIAEIWNMGCESLNPADYSELEGVLSRLCITRNIDYKAVGIEHQVITGKGDHDSDCSTNNAPAMLPAPCDCRFRDK